MVEVVMMGIFSSGPKNTRCAGKGSFANGGGGGGNKDGLRTVFVFCLEEKKWEQGAIAKGEVRKLVSSVTVPSGGNAA
jgi:hypothetical protein